jgi:hypothetical protein
MRRYLVSFLALLFLFPAVQASSEVFVTADAHNLLNYSRIYNRTVSDLETFFRLVIPRVGASLDKESKKSGENVISALRSHELYPAGIMEPVDMRILFIETRSDKLFFVKPEDLRTDSRLFIVEVVIPFPYNDELRTFFARKRGGTPVEDGIYFRFLPSVVDVPSLLMQTI